MKRTLAAALILAACAAAARAQSPDLRVEPPIVVGPLSPQPAPDFRSRNDTMNVSSSRLLDQIVDTSRLRTSGPTAQEITVNPNGTVSIPEINPGIEPVETPLVSVAGAAGTGAGTGSTPLPNPSLVDQIIPPSLINAAASGSLNLGATAGAAGTGASAGLSGSVGLGATGALGAPLTPQGLRAPSVSTQAGTGLNAGASVTVPSQATQLNVGAGIGAGATLK